jgi:hypothetical protein
MSAVLWYATEPLGVRSELGSHPMLSGLSDTSLQPQRSLMKSLAWIAQFSYMYRRGERLGQQSGMSQVRMPQTTIEPDAEIEGGALGRHAGVEAVA